MVVLPTDSSLNVEKYSGAHELPPERDPVGPPLRELGHGRLRQEGTTHRQNKSQTEAHAAFITYDDLALMMIALCKMLNFLITETAIMIKHECKMLSF